jgi:predicted glycosyltransferase
MSTWEAGNATAVAPGQGSPGGPRVVFMYAQNGAGLGHIRRCTNVATGVVAESADTRVIIASRSLVAAGAFALPERCDILKLPVFAGLGEDASGERRVLADEEDPAFARLRSRLLVDLVAELRPRAILVDNEPRGLGGEMVAALALARREGLADRIVCGLRDIRGRPDYVTRKWAGDGTAAALDDLYDLALVYGDPALFDTKAAYGLGRDIRIDVAETGYLFNGDPARDAATVRHELDLDASVPIIAVTAGSGADGRLLLERYVADVLPLLPSDAISVLVAGPLMPPAEFDALRQRARDGSRIVRSYDAVSLVAAASAVVCQAGYNSLCEAVHLGHRPLVVPRLTRSGEQETRAEAFRARGLCEVQRPDVLDGRAIAASIAGQLAQGRRTGSPFDPIASVGRAARALLG